jgi:TetR/AcrR family transcriptional regulator, cholesterol catabolism regulator
VNSPRSRSAAADDAPLRRRGRPPGSTEQGPATRQRIVQTAIELFSKNGFHATGVSELGAAVGLQPGALYYHIGSKEELLWNVLRTHIEEVLAAAQTIADSELAPTDKLRELIRSHVDTIATRQREVAIYIRDSDALTGDRAAHLQELRERVENVWLRVLTEGYRAGTFKTADHVVVNGLLGMANMVYYWYRADGPDRPDQIADKLTAVILDGLCTRPTSGARRRR